VPKQDNHRAGAGGIPTPQATSRSCGGALSGGEQQLLAIARCLCGKRVSSFSTSRRRVIQPSIIDEIVETLQRLRQKSGSP